MPSRSQPTVSIQQTPQNKFRVLRNWLTGSWGGTILTLGGAAVSIFMSGFYAGSFVTRTEFNNIIMTMRLDEQRQLQEEREKAKDAALQELKNQNEQYEQLYQRLRKDLIK